MIKSLQSLRAIGALMIFSHHFAHQSGMSGPLVESLGSCPVNWFMMLSGFVLCAAYENRQLSSRFVGNITHFMAGRFKRLAPLYYIGLGFGILVCLLIAEPLQLKSVAASALMIQSWIPVTSVFFGVNSPAWFTCDILFCYLFFMPALRLMREKPHVWRIIIALILCGYAAMLLLIPSGSALNLYLFYVVPPTQLPTFLIGMALWQCYRRIGSVKPSARAANGLISGAIALVCVAIAGNGYFPGRLTFSLFWWIPNALLIVALTLTDGIDCMMTRVLHLKPLIALGNSSMAFYLLHRPWITLSHYLVARFDLAVPIPALWAISVAVMIVIAFTIHRSFYRKRL